MNGKPLFIADSSLNHILEVIKVLGTPTKEDVISMNPNYEIQEYDLPTIKAKPFKNVINYLFSFSRGQTPSSST